MSETDKHKVQRSRKRIYEAAPEEQEVAVEASPVALVAEEEPVRPGDGSSAAADPSVTEEARYCEAARIVKRYAGWSAGAGLIPVPLADMAAFMAVEVRMLQQLAKVYDVPFSKHRSKSAVAVLLSGLNTGLLAASSAKGIPFSGLFSIAVMPAVNGAISYAVGQVFIQHFASGGTFLDFDPVKVRSYFEEQIRSGKA